LSEWISTLRFSRWKEEAQKQFEPFLCDEANEVMQEQLLSLFCDISFNTNISKDNF